MKTRRALIILATATAATSIYADKVQLSQAPAAVQQVIRSRSGRHQVEDIDRDAKNGQTTYEASWKDKNGAQQELLVSDNGTILRDVASGTNRFNRLGGAATASTSSVTNTIAGFTGAQQAQLNWASETAQNNVKSMTGGAQVDNFQKGQFQGQTAYQASFKTNGQTMMIVVGEDGKLLASSPAAASATAPATGTTAATIYPGFSNAQRAPMNWATEPVQTKIRQLANGGQIRNFQKGQYQGKTAYLSTFLQNGSVATVVVGEDGTVLSATPTAAGAPATSVSGSATK